MKILQKLLLKLSKKIVKKKAGQDREEIHTVFDLDAVIMEELDFEMDDNTKSKETMHSGKDANGKEVLDPNIKKTMDKAKDANVKKSENEKISQIKSHIVISKSYQELQKEIIPKIKSIITDGNEPSCNTSEGSIRKPKVSSSFKNIKILGGEIHRKSFSNLVRMPDVSYEEIYIPFKQEEVYTKVKSLLIKNYDTLWIIVADLSSLTRISSFCSKHFPKEKCEIPLSMYSLNDTTAAEKCTIATKFVQEQLGNLDEQSAILLIPSIPQTVLCPPNSEQLFEFHKTLHSTDEARHLPVISTDSDIEQFFAKFNSFEKEWLKTVQSVMKKQSLNQQELHNYMVKDNPVMEKLNDPQKYQGCGRNFQEWQKFIASLIRQMKSNATITKSSNDQPSPSTTSEKSNENTSMDNNDILVLESKQKLININAPDVFGRPKRCGFCNCIVHLIEECPGRLKTLQRGYNGRKPLHTNFAGRNGKIVECKYCLSITHLTKNCPYIGRPGYQLPHNESNDKENMDEKESDMDKGHWELTLTHSSKHVNRSHIEEMVKACVEEGVVTHLKRISCGPGSQECRIGINCKDKQCLLWHRDREGENDMEAYVIRFFEDDPANMSHAHSMLAHLNVADTTLNVFYSCEIPEEIYEANEEEVTKTQQELGMIINNLMLASSASKNEDQINILKDEKFNNTSNDTLLPNDLRLFLKRNQNAEEKKNKRSRRISLSPDRVSKSPRRRKSRSPQRSARSPHRSARSPLRVPKCFADPSPPRNARSPHHPRSARSPHRSARSPHRSARSPHRSARSPHRSARSPHRSARSPHRLGRSPQRIVRSPQRNQRIGRSPVRVRSRSPTRFGRSPLRVRSRSPHRISRSPLRVRSRSPYRVRSRSPYAKMSRYPILEDERSLRNSEIYRSRSPIISNIRSRSPGIRRGRSRSLSPFARNEHYLSQRSERIRSRSPVWAEKEYYRSPDQKKRIRSPDWDKRRSYVSPERRKRSISPRRVEDSYGYNMAPKEQFYEIEITFNTAANYGKYVNKHISLLLTQIFYQYGAVHVIEKPSVLERLEGNKPDTPKRLIYKFKKRSTAHIIAKYFDGFRIPDNKMSCRVIGEEGSTFQPDPEENNHLIMTLSHALKTNQNLFTKHLQEIGRQKGAFANNIFTWRTLSCKEQARKKCSNFRDCVYFHGKGDKRRDLRQVNYTDAECKEGDPCPKGDECKRAHNKAERIFHVKRIHKSICQDWYAEKKCTRKDGVCISAHPESPEVMFNDIWKDLYVVGLKQSYQYLVGAVQNLRYVNTRLPGVYVLVLTPDIYMAHWLAEAVHELAQDHHQEVAVVTDDYASAGSAHVVIGTPGSCVSLIRSGSCEVLRTLSALIMDDASLLLKEHRMKIHTIAQMLSTHNKNNDLELNRVVVTESVIQWEVDVLSNLFNTQFEVLGDVIPGTETEPMPTVAADSQIMLDDRLSMQWPRMSSPDRQQKKQFGFDPSSAKTRSYSPRRESGRLPSPPPIRGTNEMSRVQYSSSTANQSFNAPKAIKALNSVCGDMGVIGHSLRVILAKAESCVSRPEEVVRLFGEGDSVVLMELVEAKLKSLEEGAVGIRQAQTYKEALKNTRYLLQQANQFLTSHRAGTAQTPKSNHGLDIDLIAMVTLGKDTQYISKFIKNSLQLENIVPNERNIADVYDLVLEKQEEMNSKSSRSMSSNALSILTKFGNSTKTGAIAPQQSAHVPQRGPPEPRDFSPFDHSRLKPQYSTSQSINQIGNAWERSRGPGAFELEPSRAGTSRPNIFGPGPSSFEPAIRMSTMNKPEPHTSFSRGDWQCDQGNLRGMPGVNQERVSVNYGHIRNDGAISSQTLASDYRPNIRSEPLRPPGNLPQRNSPYERSQNLPSNNNSSNYYPLFGNNTESRPWL